MLRISEALKAILETNQPLRWAFHQRLLNLSALAAYIKPLVEARTKKEVQLSAIVMNLSRLQRNCAPHRPKKDEFRIKHLTVQSNLCSLTYSKTPELLNKLRSLFGKKTGDNTFFAVTQGTAEITLLIEPSQEREIRAYFQENPRNITRNLAGLGVQFDETYATVPGFLDYVLQQISMQNISVFEISSTFTELVLYISEKDLPLAFDTLFSCFNSRPGGTVRRS